MLFKTIAWNSVRSNIYDWLIILWSFLVAAYYAQVLKSDQKSTIRLPYFSTDCLSYVILMVILRYNFNENM